MLSGTPKWRARSYAMREPANAQTSRILDKLFYLYFALLKDPSTSVDILPAVMQGISSSTVRFNLSNESGLRI